MTEPLLTTEHGVVLFIGLGLGLILGALVTFIITLSMHKDKHE